MLSFVSTVERQVALRLCDDGVLPSGGPLLVALSGGADSVCLLRILLRLGYGCIAAHCDFHLRGDESERDRRFVRDLCASLSVDLHVRHFDVPAYARTHGLSTEMACRELRYAWFERVREEQGCAYIAVAHHADDNVETFFLNMLRGTGLRGLKGMDALSPSRRLLRPMLGLSRCQIEQCLEAFGQDYVTDSTNADNVYRRNSLRNAVLPVIDAHFSGGRRRILDTMRHLSDESELLDYLLCDFARRNVAAHGEVRRIPLGLLSRSPSPGMLLFALIRGDGFNRSQCDRAVGASVGARFVSRTSVLHVERDHIAVMPLRPVDDDSVELDLENPARAVPQLSVSVRHDPFVSSMVDGRGRVAFSADLRNVRRLVLRRWCRGDRIRPYGMRGSKLVSDLFADHRWSQLQKQRARILEADGEVLWVLGLRSAQAFEVDPGATDYFIMTSQTDS